MSAPDVKVERKAPKDVDEAMIRYAEAAEKMSVGFTDGPRYYVEFTWWPRRGEGQRVKLTSHVKTHRQILDELLAFRAILSDFEQEVAKE